MLENIEWYRNYDWYNFELYGVNVHDFDDIKVYLIIDEEDDTFLYKSNCFSLAAIISIYYQQINLQNM